MSWLASHIACFMKGGGPGAHPGAGNSSGVVASPCLPEESLHPALSLIRGTRVKGGKNVVRNLLRQQQTGRVSAPGATFTSVRQVIRCFRARLDVAFGGIPLLVLQLEDALSACSEAAGMTTQSVADMEEWRALTDAVAAITHKLLIDTQQQPGGDPSAGGVGDQMRRDREAFCLFTGPETLLRLFEPPFSKPDARDMATEQVNELAEVYNDVLVLLRELCFSVPDLAQRLFSSRLVLFLFTLLGHAAIFDHSVGLIEEILAEQSQTYFLGNVPNVASLLRGFSLRQLAHFNRVLALLVFEPEDRHLMESSKVLCSIDILQLRRDRMTAANSTIDRNQALLLSIPEMLPRLLKLLQVMNYSPPLSQLSHSQIVANFPPFEMLIFLGNLVEKYEWDSLDDLAALADSQTPPPTATSSSSTTPAPSSPSAATSTGNSNDGDAGRAPPDAAGAGSASASSSRPMPLGNLMSVLSPLLATNSSSPLELNVRQIIQLVQSVQSLGLSGDQHPNPAAPIVLQRLNRRGEARTPTEAHNELQFNALLLTPHQVEVLFVLCTLLGGRRKIDVQKRLASLDAVKVLNQTFDRMSWGHTTTHDGPNPLERIHGPGCSCNPESALRVQFLRCVHNFCDRDCENSTHKHLLLSSEEQRRLSAWDPTLTIAMIPPSEQPWSPDCPKGLLTKIIHVLMKERGDSMYRFWLASCVESFLRGSSAKDQLFVAETGLLRHLLDEILTEGLTCAGSLQTAFDLLGELSKCNRRVIEKLEASLSDADFSRLMKVAASNLVDSNVFIRSLVLSLHHGLRIGRGVAEREEEEDSEDEGGEEEEEEGGGEEEQHHQKGDLDAKSGEEEAKGPAAASGGRACGSEEKSYLVHSWFDVPTVPFLPRAVGGDKDEGGNSDSPCSTPTTTSADGEYRIAPPIPDGWPHKTQSLRIGDGRNNDIHSPASVPPASVFVPFRRLLRYLDANLIHLLRELMCVVDLKSVSHENLCIINTAIVMLVFARRRGLLASIMSELRTIQAAGLPSPLSAPASEDDDDDLAGAGGPVGHGGGATSRSGGGCSCHHSSSASVTASGCEGEWGDVDAYESCSDATRSSTKGASAASMKEFLRNFRELLWFWREYYHHRGRDRLSLEFSSHIRFHEWKEVVDLLCADDGQPTSLVPQPIPLPTSPYSSMATTIASTEEQSDI